jgi:hypothetical protein
MSVDAFKGDPILHLKTNKNHLLNAPNNKTLVLIGGQKMTYYYNLNFKLLFG